eukprot:CAMPEP_0175861664 /NCGR_PEP_ID=MMETSP0107_2-20121207/31509_1 /TAXON_ID=195067 ORGANISM="Goniomonas pacifica, Strain CCMP1869" /NCGR_SAMPLE_ID=MMETSP0107_2 /ASSEMBLY_ACC=CAM_ASM_000203 /LENGTH=81 /DNA_ID=CAMNT_0017178565 /DNA_START=119 /DNA_END=362 /DNA_ORIENTATION=-
MAQRCAHDHHPEDPGRGDTGSATRRYLDVLAVWEATKAWIEFLWVGWPSDKQPSEDVLMPTMTGVVLLSLTTVALVACLRY